MKTGKKLLSLLLVVMLLVCAVPFQAFADGTDPMEGNDPTDATVPVSIQKNGTVVGSTEFTIAVGGNAILNDNLVVIPEGYVYAGWKRADGSAIPDGQNLSYEFVSGQTGYSLILEVEDAPTPYSVTLRATLDGTEVGVRNEGQFTSIELTPERAKSLFSFSDAQHSFLRWEKNGAAVTGNQPLTADTIFTAVFANKHTATLKVTLGGVEVASGTFSGVTGDTVDLTAARAQALFTNYNADTHEFKGWKKADGTAAGAAESINGNPTFTAVFDTKVTPTYNVTVNVYRKSVLVTTQVLTGKTSVTLNDAFLKDVYADFDPSKEGATWYKGVLGQNPVSAGTTETLTANATYTVNITDNPAPHNVKVYVVKYVGDVNKGIISTPIFDEDVYGTVNVLDYLNSNLTEIVAEASKIGSIKTNPTFYSTRYLTSEVTNTVLTDASKNVYVRVDVPEVKNVLLYVHKGTDIKKLTTLDPKVMHGYVAGDYVTIEDVQNLLGSSVKFYGLFTEERWNNLNASIKDDGLPRIQVTSSGAEIHVWVYSGSVSNADSTNPKTGDYILDTAVTLMVISGLAAAAVYVVGKKRRV